MSPLGLVVLWPILGLIGLVCAGLTGALAAAAFLLVVFLAPPQLIVRTLPLASVSRCVLFQSQGWRRLTTRDVIEVTATEAGGADTSVWRLSASGRNRTSAETIVEALRKVGVTVALSQPEHEASTQN